MKDSTRNAFWLSSPNPMLAELAHDLGFTILVLDLEHGVFDQGELNCFMPLCRALGFEVYAKVLGPDAVPIQQALDFGASGVIIPHIEGVEHARGVTAFAKYPPLGLRSFAAGRIVRYGGVPDGFYASENTRIKCFPMVESAAALAEVEGILDLPTVDGVFVGPTDLALARGRSGYRFDQDDRADIEKIARAARRSGKPWIMPAWTGAEYRFSIDHGVAWMVVLSEQGIAFDGMRSGLEAVVGSGGESR